jgi:hypothetical protein
MNMLSSVRGGWRPKTRFLRAAGVTVIALLVTAGAAGQFLNYGLDLHAGVLDASGDGGAFGVVGQVAVASTALGALSLLSRLRLGVATTMLPVLLTFLAIDKILRLHDDLANWRLYYVPILLATVIALTLVARRLPVPSRPLVGAGLAMLSVAFVIHLSARRVLHRLGVVEDSWISQITGMAKHGSEVAGWLLITLALAIGHLELDTGRRAPRSKPTADLGSDGDR